MFAIFHLIFNVLSSSMDIILFLLLYGLFWMVFFRLSFSHTYDHLVFLFPWMRLKIKVERAYRPTKKMDDPGELNRIHSQHQYYSIFQEIENNTPILRKFLTFFFSNIQTIIAIEYSFVWWSNLIIGWSFICSRKNICPIILICKSPLKATFKFDSDTMTFQTHNVQKIEKKKIFSSFVQLEKAQYIQNA